MDEQNKHETKDFDSRKSGKLKAFLNSMGEKATRVKGAVLTGKSSNAETVDQKIMNEKYSRTIAEMEGKFTNNWKRSNSYSDKSNKTGSSDSFKQKAGKRVFCSPLNLAAEHGHHEV